MIPLHDDNPTEIFPVFTVLFIAVCVLAFFWQSSLGAEGNQVAIYGLGVIPAVLLNKLSLPPELFIIPAWQTMFTSMFLHGGFMHLAGNMLYLWIFGNNVEDAMGYFRFVIFYLVCGMAAVAGQTMQDPASQIPMIGASGAISGVLGAYLLLYPRARVLVLIPLGFISQLVRLPAGWVLALWFVIQLVSSAMSSGEGGGVAWFAHIGGFVAGMALVPLFKKKKTKLFAASHGSKKYKRTIRR